jgi:signal transduction histidine kinase
VPGTPPGWCLELLHHQPRGARLVWSIKAADPSQARRTGEKGNLVIQEAPSTPTDVTPWFPRALAAPWRGVVLCGSMFAELAVAVMLVVAVTLVPVFLGIVVMPACLLAVRREAQRTRRLTRRTAGIEIGAWYRYEPSRTAKGARWRTALPGLVGDPSTWRDVLWLFVNPTVGWVLALAPAALVLWGLFGVVMPAIWKPIVEAGGNNWYGPIHVTTTTSASACVPLGLATIVAGFALGPALLSAYGRFARWLLAPSRQSELARQVAHLAESRSEVVDHQAEEIRRIERDLHDGAQARLVAMGMTLGAVEQLLESDPAAAKKLVVGAREASAKALGELRDLVRGIHPPVLADRGLADAVRALALDSPLDISVEADLGDRLPAPVESAAYFAVSELLANVAKHADAQRVRVDLRRRAGLMRMVVTDDGTGGADPAKGSGLQGIERRVAAFDGTLLVDSPVGGPTLVRVEIPCGS